MAGSELPAIFGPVFGKLRDARTDSPVARVRWQRWQTGRTDTPRAWTYLKSLETAVVTRRVRADSIGARERSRSQGRGRMCMCNRTLLSFSSELGKRGGPYVSKASHSTDASDLSKLSGIAGH